MRRLATRLAGERGDLSLGTNTFLTGLATVIGLPLWGLVRGDFKLAAGGLLCGVVLLSLGYVLLKLEEPPKPPE